MAIVTTKILQITLKVKKKKEKRIYIACHIVELNQKIVKINRRYGSTKVMN